MKNTSHNESFPARPSLVAGNDWPSIEVEQPEAFIPRHMVTVVVPYYQAPAQLEKTLAGLERQTYPRDLFEVIVVDDGSDPPLTRPDTPLNLRVEYQEDQGFRLAEARNRGARAAQGDILLFLDCDMIPEDEWMTAHARWHHAVSDALTLGFRFHVEIDDLSTQAIRNRQGTLRELCKDRKSTRPEWIEGQMDRTANLTSDHDDLFRVVTGGNLGISRWFFELIGGFDGSFNRWGMEDVELGYRAQTRGGILIPERAAECRHQGEGAAPSPDEKASLSLQRARCSHLIAHYGFRQSVPGRIYLVPSFVITLDPLHHSVEIIHNTVQMLLANTITDLVVWVIEPRDDPRFELLRYHLDPDPRVEFGPEEDAGKRYPNSPFRIKVPAGFLGGRRLIWMLRKRLGKAIMAVGYLGRGSSISITRTWALERAIRTGQPIGRFGRIEEFDPAKLIDRDSHLRSVPWVSPTGQTLIGRAFGAVKEIRNLKDAMRVGKWLGRGVRNRLAIYLLRAKPQLKRPEKSRSFKEYPPASYPLGIEIAVAGPRSRSVFAASDRVHFSMDTGDPDLVLVDSSDPALSAWLRGDHPVVPLNAAHPLLSVPAFDPEQVNPMGWVYEVPDRVMVLGKSLPQPYKPTGPDAIDQVIIPIPKRLHHLVDDGTYPTAVVDRARILAALAASGVPIYIKNSDPDLEAHLGTELYTAMRDDRIPDAESRLREKLSIQQRRISLRTHSLRARARQIAEQVGISNPIGTPDVSMLLCTRRPENLRRALKGLGAQTYPRLELVLALHGDGFPADIDTSEVPFPVEIVRLSADTIFGRALNQATEVAGGKLLTKVDDDDLYGAEHVWDLVLAREFSRADLVAKAAEFVYLKQADRTLRRMKGAGERFSPRPTIAGGALMIAVHDLMEMGGWRRAPSQVDKLLLDDVTMAGGKTYRTHGHGYLLVRHGSGHTWEQPDSYFLDHADETRPGLDPAFAGIE
ncbi:MAG: glycosyltransferase [bacterium]|nr:glycosyltransferase [bacterium]